LLSTAHDISKQQYIVFVENIVRIEAFCFTAFELVPRKYASRQNEVAEGSKYNPITPGE
jgi:hypothetical protein